MSTSRKNSRGGGGGRSISLSSKSKALGTGRGRKAGPARPTKERKDSEAVLRANSPIS